MNHSGSLDDSRVEITAAARPQPPEVVCVILRRGCNDVDAARSSRLKGKDCRYNNTYDQWRSVGYCAEENI